MGSLVLLDLMGGVALLLWGLHMVHSGILRAFGPNLRLLLVVGFLGGYTTFSSFAYETFVATREGSPWMGLLNVVASVALGYIAVWLGMMSAR